MPSTTGVTIASRINSEANKTEINIYHSASVLSFAPRIAEFLTLLDKDELAIAKRFKFPDLRERYIINHGILRQLLAAQVNESPAKLCIKKAEFGKPFLADFPDLSFNMSHSGDSLAIAISSECQLGIDIECYKARDTWEGLVKKCFSVEEAKYWHTLSEAERGSAFYQFWVKKEAFVKAVGKGITLSLNQCVINPDDLNAFLRVPELAGSADQWQVYTLDLSESEFAAVVCDRRDGAVRLNMLALE